MASNSLKGWTLGPFWLEFGSPKSGQVPKFGILKSFKYACIVEVAFNTLSGLFLEGIWMAFGLAYSLFGPRNVRSILFSESRSPLSLCTRFQSRFLLAVKFFSLPLKRHAHSLIIKLPLCPSSGKNLIVND